MSQPQLTVAGGVGGTEAHYEDLALLARNSDDLAVTLGEISAKCHAMLVDPDVVASAVLDPEGAAKFEATLLSALDGEHGLTALAARYGTRAIALRATAAAYQASDKASAALTDQIRWSAGHFFAETLPVSAPLLVLGGGALLMGSTMVNPIGTAQALADPQRFLTDHPGILDNVIGASPGLITGLTGLPTPNVTSGAHLLGALYPDGHPHVQKLDGPLDSDSMKNPPTNLETLVAGLAYRNNQAHASTDQIDVRTVIQPDGSKSYIVDIPGTKDWSLPNGHLNPHTNNLGTNVQVLAGDVTSRERAIAEALHQAGASSTDPVMLVGHSQGGMVAAQAAADTSNGVFNYNVTHIVTAGSPIAHAAVPSHVQVLSIENAHDLVPHLDAADNPDRPNWTTVTVDNQLGNPGLNHSADLSYLPAAGQLDNTTSSSVTAFRRSADVFMGHGDRTAMHTQVYQLSRTP